MQPKLTHHNPIKQLNKHTNSPDNKMKTHRDVKHKPSLKLTKTKFAQSAKSVALAKRFKL